MRPGIEGVPFPCRSVRLAMFVWAGWDQGLRTPEEEERGRPEGRLNRGYRAPQPPPPRRVDLLGFTIDNGRVARTLWAGWPVRKGGGLLGHTPVRRPVRPPGARYSSTLSWHGRRLLHLDALARAEAPSLTQWILRPALLAERRSPVHMSHR
jgi:hypothetical protein